MTDEFFFNNLPNLAVANIFKILSKLPEFLKLRLVSRKWKSIVEKNSKLELKWSCQYQNSVQIFLLNKSDNSFDKYIIYQHLRDVRESQLIKCVKRISLHISPGHMELYRRYLSNFEDILTNSTYSELTNQNLASIELDINCSIDITTSELSLLYSGNRNLCEEFSIYRSVSFNFTCITYPFPDFVIPLMKYYLINSKYLETLAISDVRLFKQYLDTVTDTDQIWSKLQTLNLRLKSRDIQFSPEPMKLCSDINMYQKIPNLSNLSIDIDNCVMDLNGLANFNNLKTVNLSIHTWNLTREQIDKVYNPINFRQKLKTVQQLTLTILYKDKTVNNHRFDFIIEQFACINYLDIIIQNELDEITLINSIQNGSLDNLKKLKLTRHEGRSRIQPICSLFTNNSIPISINCPKLIELDIQISIKSSWHILINCSELIKKLTINLARGRTNFLAKVIKRMELNEHTNKIIVNVEECLLTNDDLILRHYAKLFRKENRMTNGYFIKCKDAYFTYIDGALIWETKENKNKRELYFDGRY